MKQYAKQIDLGDEVNALRLYLPLVRLGKVLDLQKVLWPWLI